MAARRLFVVGIATLGFILVVALLAMFRPTSLDLQTGITLASTDDLEEREVMWFPDEDLFLVWNDGDPLALSSDAQHVGDEVEWCESSGMFESPAHGEKFDSRGYYYGGPAARGLARYPLEIVGDAIILESDEPSAGPERGEGPAHEPRGNFC